MALQWVSVALTLTGIFIWFSGTNQGLGYGIFMAGGVMWFILQKAEKNRHKTAKHKPAEIPPLELNPAKKPKLRRQSDAEN